MEIEQVVDVSYDIYDVDLWPLASAELWEMSAPAVNIAAFGETQHTFKKFQYTTSYTYNDTGYDVLADSSTLNDGCEHA